MYPHACLLSSERIRFLKVLVRRVTGQAPVTGQKRASRKSREDGRQPGSDRWKRSRPHHRRFSTPHSNGTNKVIDTQGTSLLFSSVYTEAHARQFPVPGLAPVSICHPLPCNSLRVRTSKTPLPQPLCNPHLRRPFGCAGNKGLASARIHRQLFCNQHLRTPLRSAGNTGVINLLESALTKNAPATPLESALTKNRGGGGTAALPLRLCASVAKPLSVLLSPRCARLAPRVKESSP